MSQSTDGEPEDWFRSTLPYDHPLFGSSSSGSDYDTEDALSQPTTDEECAGSVAGATVPSRGRPQSPVTVRYGGTQGPAPRRPRSVSPIIPRYIVSEIRGLDGMPLQTRLCLHLGCQWPARVWQNFEFCSRTCGNKVRVSFYYDT
jgi:hypothetical protein